MDAEAAPPPSAAAEPAPAVKALSCPSCGGTVELRAAGYTVTVACQYCSSLLDVANPDVRLIAEYHQAAAELLIPLGTRGTLRGIEWEAIGYLERSESGAYGWSEYLLFNPYHGYRFLITDGRGWSLGEMLTVTPEPWADGLKVGERRFDRFFRDGRAQVDYVVGEFYWRVQVGEEVRTDDWVSPGFMLSREQNAHEVSWTISELLPDREMRDAFGVGPSPDKWPPLPHQPSPYGPDAARMLKIGAAAGLLVLLLLAFFSGGPLLVRETVPYTLDAAQRSATVGPITLARPWQLVAITARAPDLDNSWVDLDYSLVERTSQTAYQAWGAAERYSGRDSDGDWTEGSRSSRVKLAAVPKGTYDLVVDYQGNRWGGAYRYPDLAYAAEPERKLEIEVRSGMLFPSNALLALILILLPLIFVLIRHVKFEQARQDQSDVGRTGVAKLFTSDDSDYDEDDE